MNKMYIKILRFLTDGSASETIELIMRTGTSRTKLQQMSPAFVNKKIRLMTKKKTKIRPAIQLVTMNSSGFFCYPLPLPNRHSAQSLSQVEVAGQVFFTVPRP